MASLPTVIRLSNWLAGHAPEGIWVYGLEPEPVAEFTGSYELRKLTMKWSRSSPSGVAQDDAMCTFHLLNLTDGVPDSSWVTGDYTTCEGLFAAFWNSIRNYYSPTVVHHEFEWRADGPAYKPFGSSLSPTLRIETTSVPGVDTSHDQRLPPQVAMSVTERTAAHYTAYGVGVPGHVSGTGRTQVRNRWGRFYLPAMQSAYLDNVGRWRTDITADVADSVNTLYDSLVSADFIPVMYSPTTGNAWSIDEIAIDDIVDVIRSRRWTDVQDRAVQTIG